MSCLRKILWALTLLIWLSGAALVGLSGYIMVKDMKFKGLTGNKILDGVMLGVACFIFVLGFVGCIGVTLQKRSILKIFFILLLLFFVIQAGIITDFVIQKSQIEGLWTKTWPGMTDEGRIAVQKELKCCGLSASEDNNHASYNDTSCFTSDARTTRRKACFDALLSWIKENYIILAVAGGLLCLLEIVLMVCSCLFIREIGRNTMVVPLDNKSTRDMVPMYSSNQQQQQHNHMSIADVEDSDDYIILHTRKNWAKQTKHSHR